MMLKKQTVWLLTMLSLIIVLSVYYMTSPPSPTEMAMTNEQQEEPEGSDKGAAKQESNKDTTQGKTDTSNVSSDQGFTAYEIDRSDARSQLMQQYTDVMASEESTPQQIAEAKDKLTQLQQLAADEKMLESLLVAQGYQDALVSTEGENVRVIVKADHESTEQANKILNLTLEQLGANKNVAVEFQKVN